MKLRLRITIEYMLVAVLFFLVVALGVWAKSCEIARQDDRTRQIIREELRSVRP